MKAALTFDRGPALTASHIIVTRTKISLPRDCASNLAVPTLAVPDRLHAAASGMIGLLISGSEGAMDPEALWARTAILTGAAAFADPSEWKTTAACLKASRLSMGLAHDSARAPEQLLRLFASSPLVQELGQEIAAAASAPSAGSKPIWILRPELKDLMAETCGIHLGENPRHSAGVLARVACIGKRGLLGVEARGGGCSRASRRHPALVS